MTALDPASIDLPSLVSLAGIAVNEHLLRQLREAGHPKIRNSHGFVFQHLLGGARTVGELASLLGVTQQGASKAASELEALGYVERLPSPEDSRIRRVTLTAKGRAVVERARAARSAFEKALLAEIGPKAMKSTREALLAVLEHTGNLDAVKARRVRPPSS